jgi:hypothetical protein
VHATNKAARKEWATGRKMGCARDYTPPADPAAARTLDRGDCNATLRRLPRSPLFGELGGGTPGLGALFAVAYRCAIEQAGGQGVSNMILEVPQTEGIDRWVAPPGMVGAGAYALAAGGGGTGKKVKPRKPDPKAPGRYVLTYAGEERDGVMAQFLPAWRAAAAEGLASNERGAADVAFRAAKKRKRARSPQPPPSKESLWASEGVLSTPEAEQRFLRQWGERVRLIVAGFVTALVTQRQLVVHDDDWWRLFAPPTARSRRLVERGDLLAQRKVDMLQSLIVAEAASVSAWWKRRKVNPAHPGPYPLTELTRYDLSPRKAPTSPDLGLGSGGYWWVDLDASKQPQTARQNAKKVREANLQTAVDAQTVIGLTLESVMGGTTSGAASSSSSASLGSGSDGRWDMLELLAQNPVHFPVMQRLFCTDDLPSMVALALRFLAAYPREELLQRASARLADPALGGVLAADNAAALSLRYGSRPLWPCTMAEVTGNALFAAGLEARPHAPPLHWFDHRAAQSEASTPLMREFDFMCAEPASPFRPFQPVFGAVASAAGAQSGTDKVYKAVTDCITHVARGRHGLPMLQNRSELVWQASLQRNQYLQGRYSQPFLTLDPTTGLMALAPSPHKQQTLWIVGSGPAKTLETDVSAPVASALRQHASSASDVVPFPLFAQPADKDKANAAVPRMLKIKSALVDWFLLGEASWSALLVPADAAQLDRATLAFIETAVARTSVEAQTLQRYKLPAQTAPADKKQSGKGAPKAPVCEPLPHTAK